MVLYLKSAICSPSHETSVSDSPLTEVCYHSTASSFGEGEFIWWEGKLKFGSYFYP
jgi:hypothetical protein